MSQQKPREKARKAWEVPEVVTLDAGRAEQTGLSSADGTGPGTNLS